MRSKTRRGAQVAAGVRRGNAVVRPFVVRAISARATRGVLDLGGGRQLPCAMGRSGRRALKREGDGATPLGRHRVRFVLWRADRSLPPPTALPCRPIRPDDGWCDAVGDRNYNRRVRHPYPASAEHLWREDHLYDIVVVLDANERPRKQGAGSAIFLHLARPGYQPTAGCVALTRRDLVRVLGLMRRRHSILVRD